MDQVANYKLSNYVTKVFETPSTNCSEWFGYYNYDTLNDNQTKLLCGRSMVDGVNPSKYISIELGYYDIPSGLWHHIGESDSWNWQQGAMLQWLDNENGKEKVIYNCSKNGHLISRIHNLKTGENRDIDWPIYGITPDGKKSITLDLERSYWCRAYHYQSVANYKKDGRVYEDDGIYEIDLDNNTKKTIITIQDIINTDYRPYFAEQKHWLEHIMISPSGKRFCFLHRFSPINNIMSYETRLFIANIDGSDLQCINGWDRVQWSHFGWCGDESFTIYTCYPSRLKTFPTNVILTRERFSIKEISKIIIRKSISYLPHKLAVSLGSAHSSYQFYSYCNNMFKLQYDIAPKQSRIDGHPSFTSDGSFMITDTYGDKQSWQSLYLYDLKTKKSITLARFFAFYNKKAASCDLHPKLCVNNNYIVVDTAYNDKHHMVVLKIDWSLIPTK